MVTIQQSEAQAEKPKEVRKAKEAEKAKTAAQAQKGARTSAKAKRAVTPKAKEKQDHLHLSGCPHLVENHRQDRQTDHHATSF